MSSTCFLQNYTNDLNANNHYSSLSSENTNEMQSSPTATRGGLFSADMDE
jgi:hypothetical protein